MSGLVNPLGEFVGFGGAVAAGTAEWTAGGNFLGVGFQAGGLAGGLVGGMGWATRMALANGTRLSTAVGRGLASVAPDLAGGVVGAGLGAYHHGTVEGTLHGAFLGTGITSLGRLGIAGVRNAPAIAAGTVRFGQGFARASAGRPAAFTPAAWVRPSATGWSASAAELLREHGELLL